jgi:hypothetical protein
VVGGSPSDAEEEAARTAIVALWNEARADAAQRSGLSPWVVLARAESTKRGALVGRGRPNAWRLSGRLRAIKADPTQTGRGDAK